MGASGRRPWLGALAHRCGRRPGHDEAARWLARLGAHDNAIALADLAVTDVESIEVVTQSVVLSNVAETFRLCGATDHAVENLVEALRASRLGGRGALARVLAAHTDTLASSAPERTLLRLVEEMRRIDAWLDV